MRIRLVFYILLLKLVLVDVLLKTDIEIELD